MVKGAMASMKAVEEFTSATGQWDNILNNNSPNVCFNDSRTSDGGTPPPLIREEQRTPSQRPPGVGSKLAHLC